MTTFKVMTWNVENLYRFGNAFGPKTQEKYTEKLKSLAKVILALDPDVLALQEIGDLKALDELLALLQGRYPHTHISASPDPRGIRVGFLAKLAIEEHEEIAAFPEGSLLKVRGQDTEESITEITRMGRGALRILVRPKQDMAIHLINAHLKSKLLTFPPKANQPRFAPSDENERARVAGLALLRRTAEAVALRVKANELLENNAKQGLIILGDLNDVPSAATTQILQGPNGSEIGTAGFKHRDKGDDTRLFNLASLIPQERRYSRVYQTNKELIDHIFVSQELLPGQPRQLPKVDSHVDIGATLPSISDDPNQRRGEPGSDHAPITAIFNL
ncbi:endonuclease/exonuclease/phosphatase family protein [Leptolyngbya sp. FACHB-261]|uniref:endonuclease/exonuclease/phosphatase family protein n=1 Tax=Leptolyngbya sp. FACHB-261 TaxID=2692806 RepID=UPI001682B3AD|nr:endonuclease/exonuclease/phosphatase family protein [Leptolyngbya sp. FACHB-261]MBD2100043.1 endonuclease/exonuclease/phosphatase family protein [Leptolyngbya sp. FACHB-261]